MPFLVRIRAQNLGRESYKPGCIGDRSTPMTLASGCSSAKSIAQIPVPVPTSSTRLTLESGSFGGAKPSLLSKVKMNKLCWRSNCKALAAGKPGKEYPYLVSVSRCHRWGGYILL
jgi:hypothetical protein